MNASLPTAHLQRLQSGGYLHTQVSIVPDNFHVKYYAITILLPGNQ